MSELWDAEAATFDQEPDHGLADPDTRAAWLALLTSHLPAAPCRIADLGSGTGTLSVLLADVGHEVDGVDFSPAMVERARAKAGDRPDVTFVTADAAAPPLEPGTYDAVLCRHVLWALPDPLAALRHWIALLKPAGRLLLVEGNWQTGVGLTAEQTLGLVREAGRAAELVKLPDAVYWGRQIEDERYLVVA
jgi:SAM-dependent methyltransferase